MAKSFRLERLNESIKELLGEMILSRIKDPRIGLVTITEVDVARDMTSAKVFFTVMGGDQERAESREGLESAKNFLRKTIARELKLRSAPEFRFVYDDSLDRSLEIEDTLRQLKDEDEKRET